MKHPFANLSGSSSSTIKKSLIFSDYYCTRMYANDAKKHGLGLTRTNFSKQSSQTKVADLAGVGWGKSLNTQQVQKLQAQY